MWSTKLFLSVPLFLATSIAQCFFPDGSAYAGAVICDITTSDGQSSCCGIEDECTTNGFCKWQGFRNNNILSVAGCSDRSWTSSNCAQFCRSDPATGIKHNGNQFVFACSQTTYCCSPYQGVLPGGYTDRPSNYSCCNDPSQVFDAGPANYLALRHDFTTSSFTATATGSPTAASSGARVTGAVTVSPAASGAANGATTSSSSSDELSAGAKAGIGIGAALVGIIAIALAAWLTLSHRRKSSASAPLLAYNGKEEEKPPVPYDAGAWQAQAHGQTHNVTGSGFPHEIGLGSGMGPGELSADVGRRELP